MKRTVWWALLSILAFLLLPLDIGYAAETEKNVRKPKVIAVVIDNSTSMVRDDPGSSMEQYTTRWVEADYAVRALAAMMDAGDILKLYPFSVDAPVDIQIGKERAYEDLCENLDKMNYYGMTPSETIKTATEDLKKEEDKDCYLIVISDGNLKSGDGTGPDMTQKEVDREFDDIVSANPSLQIKYIPIGKGDMCLPNHAQVELCRNSNNDNITQQITDAINSIYHRVAVSNIDKIDIPVKNMTFFLQNNSNAEEFFNAWDSEQYGYRLNGKTAINSTRKNPVNHWKSNEELRSDWVKTTTLSGLVMNYTVPSVSNDFVAVPSGGNIQVYYEPAVTQRITVQQNDDTPYVYDENLESHFVEGSIRITIEYLDMKGELLKSQKAAMLKLDQVTVSVNEHALTAEQDLDTGVYTFFGTLNPDDSGYLTITNGIGLNNGRLNIPLGVIGEPYVELSATPLDEELILDETGSTVLRIQISDAKGGNIFIGDGKWENFLTPICTSENFNVDVANCKYYPDGSVWIPVSLKDPSKHQINSQESFNFSIKRKYNDDRAPETTGQTMIQVKINSQEHSLEVVPAKTSAQFDAWQIYLHGKEIPISYTCDGETLSPEQLEAAAISLVEGESVLSGVTSLENGNICINRFSPHMWRVDDMQIQVQIVFSYTKWNKPADTTYQIFIEIKPFPLIIVAAVFTIVIVLISIFLIWVYWLLCPGNSARREYIPRKTEFKFERVVGTGTNPESNFVISWGFGKWLLFRASPFTTRYAHIRKSIRKNTVHPNINLYIHRNDEDTWTLTKLSRISPSMDSDYIQIGEEPVSIDNCRFSTEKSANNCLKIKNFQGTSSWKLQIIVPEHK